MKKLSDDVLFVALRQEPQLQDELGRLNEAVGNRNECDVIIDFAQVDIVTSSSIANLMILRDSLLEAGRQLFLCNCGLPTKGIFVTLGLQKLFTFTADKSSALAAIQSARQASPEPV